MTLRPCPACARHIYETEAACPFCQEPIAPAAARSLIFNAPAGASRAQLYALAAAMLGQGLVGCKEEVAIPIYGAPPQKDGGAAGVAAGAGALPRAGGSGAAGQPKHPVYGAPPPRDAGVPTAGAPASDAGQAASAGTAGAQSQGGTSGGKGGHGGQPMAVPLYGAPPRSEK